MHCGNAFLADHCLHCGMCLFHWPHSCLPSAHVYADRRGAQSHASDYHLHPTIHHLSECLICQCRSRSCSARLVFATQAPQSATGDRKPALLFSDLALGSRLWCRLTNSFTTFPYKVHSIFMIFVKIVQSRKIRLAMLSLPHDCLRHMTARSALWSAINPFPR